MSRDAVVLIGVQMAGAIVLSIPALTLIGACAGWVPALGTALGGLAVWMFWGRRQPERLQRAHIRKLALGSGLAHGLGAGAVYGLVYLVQPSWFDFGPVALLALVPAIGLGAGGLALALTLVAGDGAAAALGIALEPPTTTR